MKESEWIRYLLDRVPQSQKFTGIGDDAAIIQNHHVVSTDTFVENIHFKQDWADWKQIGKKMAIGAQSDMFAMGALPLYMLANLSTSEGEAASKGILEGILSIGVPLVGGDTTSAASGSTTVSITVFGSAPCPLQRSGAQEGDFIYVSGSLGGSKAGLYSLQNNLGLTQLEDRFLSPPIRRDISQEWASKAHAMIDISDGLSNELYHLADASGVKCVIDTSAIPLFSGIEETDLNPLLTAFSSGDEFELLATSPVELPNGIRIGKVEKGAGVITEDGVLSVTGYDHNLGDRS